MTDSNQVRILYVNLVLVSTSLNVQSRSSHQLTPVPGTVLYCSLQQVSSTSTVPSICTYLYCSVRPGTCFCIPQYWYVPLPYKVTCKSTQYLYIPILRPGTSYQIVPIRYQVRVQMDTQCWYVPLRVRTSTTVQPGILCQQVLQCKYCYYCTWYFN